MKTFKRYDWRLSMLKATVAIINRDADGIPVYILDIPVAENVLYRYYNEVKSDDIVNSAKALLGISSKTLTFSAVFTEFLIHPLTGDILYGDDFSREDFIQAIYDQRAAYMYGWA